eukprot:scaffold43121_cov54-Phaeocystis_antarctica.AAC.1
MVSHTTRLVCYAIQRCPGPSIYLSILKEGFLKQSAGFPHETCKFARLRPPLIASMSRARPQCGAPDLSTFKAATSSDEQRAMHAEPEARWALRA